MYLIYGESFRLIAEEIDKIIKDSTNIVSMDLSVHTLEDVIREATYVSMFEEKKYIIVRNATFFTSAKEKSEDLDILFSYMENPIPLTTIIFTAYDKIDLRKKITKTFSEKYKMISVENLSSQDLMTKVRDLAFHSKYKISNETLQFILQSCQNNYDLIYNEMQKIFLYYMEPQTIQLEDVKQILSRTLTDNNFRFIEAVVTKDAKKALSILNDLTVLKVDPIALILLLAREYRLMYSVKCLMGTGYPKKTVCKELGLQDWQIDKLLRNTSNYYQDDLATYIKKLANIDYKIKSGNMDKFLALKTFLLEVL